MNEKPEAPTFDSWAVVELFGHQKISGRCTEQAIAGSNFLRVDVPACDADGQPAYTRFFSHGAIYSINPTTEEIARAMVRRCAAQPVNQYELPAPAEQPVSRDQLAELAKHPEPAGYYEEDKT